HDLQPEWCSLTRLFQFTPPIPRVNITTSRSEIRSNASLVPKNRLLNGPPNSKNLLQYGYAGGMNFTWPIVFSPAPRGPRFRWERQRSTDAAQRLVISLEYSRPH